LDNTYYVTPETQMYLLAEDASPVSIFYSLTNGPYLPALPFRLRTPGAYDLRYYALDASHNLEPTNQTTLVLSDDAPAVASAAIDEPVIIAAGDALSVRPAFTRVTFQAGASPVRVDAGIDVFRGVVGWATVRGVPSSPTRQDSVSLGVAGENVDYYRYRVDGGVWSPERKVAEPIALTALPVGAHTVAVLGRSAHGSYLAETNAIQVGWTIDAAAPATEISGVPETPTRSRAATLTVGGVAVTDYRWNLNDSYYRAESPTATPLALTQLTGATQVVAVVGKTGGVYQPTNNPTLVTWWIDPGYGGDCSSLTQVRSVALTNVGVGAHSFTWDARADDGTLLPPGWYTIKLTLRDELGRFSFATRLVQIGELSGAPTSVAEFGRGACRPDARRSWAVWQDQSDGNFEIYALDLSRAGNSPVALTPGLLSQENPKTDGRYVVWQSRQPNGSWDVWLADLTSAEAPRALTATPTLDEINPAIDWPWVVYVVNRTANAALPWQVYAHNLVTHQTQAADPGPQDQLDPAVQAGRVVWQDHRDVGFGEIYFKDLETGAGQRLTTNTFGQYFPAIDGSWIVWQDNRHGQVEIYGFDLLRQIEVRLTDSPANEAHPHLEGPWLVCEEDSLGVLTSNLRLLHLPSLRAVPLTGTTTLKTRGSLAGGYAVWQEETAGSTRIMAAPLPALQGVFANRNAVPVTLLMASERPDAFSLLRLWHAQAGVQEITRFTSLLPQVVSQSACWLNGQPAGDNFALSAGSFLWIRFESRHMLDLGPTEDAAVDLAAGLNVLSYLRFPRGYSAFTLLRQLGLDRVRAVRMLDAESGRWVVAQVHEGAVVGEDFAIPNVAVVWVDMLAAVNAFRPQ
jgi:beta propeller repeat protein